MILIENEGLNKWHTCRCEEGEDNAENTGHQHVCYIYAVVTTRYLCNKRAAHYNTTKVDIRKT